VRGLKPPPSTPATRTRRWGPRPPSGSNYSAAGNPDLRAAYTIFLMYQALETSATASPTITLQVAQASILLLSIVSQDKGLCPIHRGPIAMSGPSDWVIAAE